MNSFLWYERGNDEHFYHKSLRGNIFPHYLAQYVTVRWEITEHFTLHRDSWKRVLYHVQNKSHVPNRKNKWVTFDEFLKSSAS